VVKEELFTKGKNQYDTSDGGGMESIPPGNLAGKVQISPCFQKFSRPRISKEGGRRNNIQGAKKVRVINHTLQKEKNRRVTLGSLSYCGQAEIDEDIRPRATGETISEKERKRKEQILGFKRVDSGEKRDHEDDRRR